MEVDFMLNRKYNHDEIANSWLYNVELSGGGKFFDIAPHTIDIMVFLLGDFTRLYGFAKNNNDEYKVEDVVTMCFETEKGIIGTANFNSIALDKKDKMLIYGTKGYIEFSIHGNTTIKVKTNEEEIEYNIEDPKIIQENMIKEVIRELLTKIKGNTCYGNEALETYRIIDKVLNEYYNGRDDGFWKKF